MYIDRYIYFFKENLAGFSPLPWNIHMEDGSAANYNSGW
jgi:hypothetical protein